MVWYGVGYGMGWHWEALGLHWDDTGTRSGALLNQSKPPEIFRLPMKSVYFKNLKSMHFAP
jgi:hypothetical protein